MNNSERQTKFPIASRLIEWVVIISVFLAACIISLYFQKPLSYNNGLGWDGSFYFSMANQIVHHLPIVDEAPYVYRVGVPFFVALLWSGDLRYGFFLFNLFASLAETILLVIWLRFHVMNWVWRVLLVSMFLAVWLSPLRSAFYSPTQIEPLSEVTTLLGLILIENWRINNNKTAYYLLCALSFFGIFVRESTILVPGLFFLSNVVNGLAQEKKLNKRNLLLASGPLIFSVAGLITDKYLVTPTNSYQLLAEMLLWFYTKPFPTYLHSYFTTYGPMIAIILVEWKAVREFLSHSLFNTFFLIATCGLAWVIGSDTDRFLFWGMPVWYAMFGIALEKLWPLLKKNLVILAFMLIVQAVAQHALFPIPDFAPEKIEYRIPLFTVLCNDGCALDLSSYNGWSGTGVQTAGCSVYPCILNGSLFPIKIFQIMEDILASALLIYFLEKIKRRNVDTKVLQPPPS
jgi:hypothetical protein